MTVLAFVGVALVLFGGLVLLRFPDRPGGRIAWQGMEVSSVGAGLPLIVVGVVAIAFSAVNGNGVGSGHSSPRAPRVPTSATQACFRTFFGGIAADRLATIEEGARDFVVIRSSQSESGAFGLRLTDLAKTVGGVTAAYFPASHVFKIEAVANARCRPVADLQDLDRPSADPHALQNWDTLRMHLGDRYYALTLGSSPAIEADFYHVTP